jgi:hypothetical protein
MKRLDSGPKKLNQASRDFLGIMTAPIALQEYQKDLKKNLVRRNRRVTRRGKTTTSNPSHRTSKIKTAPTSAAAIAIVTSSKQDVKGEK